MDEILHRLGNPGIMIPSKYQPTMVSHSFNVVRTDFVPAQCLAEKLPILRMDPRAPQNCAAVALQEHVKSATR